MATILAHIQVHAGREADFEAITRVGGAGGPRMLWSVATLRSHAERNAWVQAQRRAHPSQAGRSQ